MYTHEDADDSENLLTESQRHELLANRIRQETLATLAEETGPIPLAELAEAVRARFENGRNPDVRSIRIELHHTHLPLLDDYGLLRYDHSSNEVLSNCVTSAVFEPESHR